MEDPGSIGASGEPTVAASLQAGVAVVTASGDKLLGGPQAGIILGERVWVEKMRANPLARAVRLDKLQLSALEATLRLYLTDAADASVPVRRMARLKEAELRRRARGIADAVRAKAPEGVTVEVVRSKEALGGGSAPDTVLKGWSVALGFGKGPITASGMERALREGDPPLVARVSEEQVILTIRSVLPSQDARIAPLVVRALRRAANRSS
jgi:L-seryl-tRNA(Ser) seleniumtransferase